MTVSSNPQTTSVMRLSLVGLLPLLAATAAACGKSSAPEMNSPSSAGAAGSTASGGTTSSGGSLGATGGTAAPLCARAHCPEQLYDRRPSLILRGGGLDERDVYWCELANEGNLVKAAPKDGSGPVRTLGPWWDFEVDSMLVVDEAHVYWVRPEGTGSVMRVNKDGSGAINLPLPGAASTATATPTTTLDLGPIIDAGDALLVATHGCTQIIRVPKDGSATASWPLSKDRNAGGETDLERDGEQVYCSNGKFVHRLDLRTGKASVITDALSMAGPMKKIGDVLYVANDRPVTNTAENLASIDPDGTVTDLGATFGNVENILYDGPRSVLLWVTGPSLSSAEIVTFHLDRSDPPELLFDHQSMNSSFTADADYIYWGADQAVMRLRKE